MQNLLRYSIVNISLCSVNELVPDDSAEKNFWYTFKVQCVSCREIHPNFININRFVSRVKDSKDGKGLHSSDTNMNSRKQMRWVVVEERQTLYGNASFVRCADVLINILWNRSTDFIYRKNHLHQLYQHQFHIKQLLHQPVKRFWSLIVEVLSWWNLNQR